MLLNSLAHRRGEEAGAFLLENAFLGGPTVRPALSRSLGVPQRGQHGQAALGLPTRGPQSAATASWSQPGTDGSWSYPELSGTLGAGSRDPWSYG